MENILEFVSDNGIMFPYNENAHDFIEIKKHKEICYLKSVEKRDMKFHNCYFLFLAHVYSLMPNLIKSKVPKAKFYIFLKHICGEYDIISTFSTLPPMIEYQSVKYEKMDSVQFRSYVFNQLPKIYDLISKFYDENNYKKVIENIELEFENFLSKIN